MKTQRNGAILPLVAILAIAMILVLGLMVELNWLYATRFEAQSASDLAARSALARLYDNTNDLDQAAIDEAKGVGVQIYESNFSSHPITEDDIIFGAVRANKSFRHMAAPVGLFRKITASRVKYDQKFTSLLGTLMAKDDINLPVFSVAETKQFEMVLCLDASRSMNEATDQSNGRLPPGQNTIHAPPLPGSRWFALVDEVDTFLGSFSETDSANLATQSSVALVTFGGGLTGGVESPLDADFARLELEFKTIATNKPLVNETLDGYVDFPALGLGTSIYDGIDISTTILENRSAPAEQCIVLFSDGHQVVRGQRPSELEAVERTAALEIPIYVIAFHVDDKNLKEIASLTGGQYFSVDSEDELKTAFESIANSVGTRITQ